MSKSKIVWKDWNPERVKDDIKEKAAEQMEQVCADRADFERRIAILATLLSNGRGV